MAVVYSFDPLVEFVPVPVFRFLLRRAPGKDRK